MPEPLFRGDAAPATSEAVLREFEDGLEPWTLRAAPTGDDRPADLASGGAATIGPVRANESAGTAESAEAPALVVVSPHPDDEVLGAGALLGTAARAGIPTLVLAVTDGNASHPPELISPEDLAEVRSAESDVALATLAELDADPDHEIRRSRLRLPDGRVSEHEDALAERIAEALGQLPPGTWVAAPLRHDGHPDHDATGRAARRALARVPTARLVEYPVWLWQHTLPREHPGVDWDSARVLVVDDELDHARSAAMVAFRSQISLDLGVPAGRVGADPEHQVVLPRRVRDRMLRRRQVVFPHGAAGFAAIYDRGEDPWSVDERWYEERKYALTVAMLPRRTFRRGYEPGCSIGGLTALLADRCEQLLATDIVPAAVETARERVPHPHVDFRVGGVADWPAGELDLVVLSELAYYLSDSEFEDALRYSQESLAEDGVLAAAHWRHAIPGAYRDAEAIHRALADQPGWERLASYRDEDVLIETFGPPRPSVASGEFFGGG
ncbi:bifunctional PIG-L family deacetylase/class I SAM-dependent methyltransferase [Georgenia sp. Z1491]|uniref:bifunctional PIG-L family deacetylase/class I SAM-dependent methyltransferase n=1 Tax=Georgenia sp. Z1491 TaxID=3416707 RepID=UPI003CEEB973